MSYDPLTPEKFKEMKPQFKCASDDEIQPYIDLASMWVGKSWPEKIYQVAWASMTCHLLTLDGIGSSAEAQSQANGTAQFQSIKSGDLTLTRYQKAAETMTYQSWLGQTKCGAMFYNMLRLTRAGPRVAMGGIIGVGASAWAKDHPLGTGGWPSWWWSGQ